MKPYICKPCDYNTYSKKDFDKHTKTLKHQAKCSDEIAETMNPLSVQCTDCYTLFDSEEQLNKHIVICPVAFRMKIMTLEKENLELKLQKERENSQLKLENVLKELELSNKFHDDIDVVKERIIEIMKGENEYHKETIDKQATTVNKITTGAIRYLQQHCPNAPRLEAPENYDELWEDFEDDKDFLEKVSAWNSNNHLAVRLSDRLLKIYQKKDGSQQSLWGVDSSRINYAEKEDDWIFDKKGVKIREKVVIPFINDLLQRVNDLFYLAEHDKFLFPLYGALKTTLISGKEALIKQILQRMCSALYLNKDGNMKNGKFLTYIEPDKKEGENAEEVIEPESPKPIKKKSPKKKTLKKEPEPYHSTDSSDHPSDSDQCDKKYDERVKAEAKKTQKEIVIIDTKKKGKRV